MPGLLSALLRLIAVSKQKNYKYYHVSISAYMEIDKQNEDTHRKRNIGVDGYKGNTSVSFLRTEKESRRERHFTPMDILTF